MAIAFGIAAGCYLSYAFMDQRQAGASANSENPLPYPGSATPPLQPDTAYVSAGTRIHVRLDETISAEKAIAGERFTAVLYGPLIVGSQFLAPSRSKIIGRLAQATEPAVVDGHPQLAMVLQSLLVNGKEYDLQTEPLALTRTGRCQAIQREQETLGPNAQFTLSQTLELPVIRKMGPMQLEGRGP
jgi:hypothetical protein